MKARIGNDGAACLACLLQAYGCSFRAQHSELLFMLQAAQ